MKKLFLFLLFSFSLVLTGCSPIEQGRPLDINKEWTTSMEQVATTTAEQPAGPQTKIPFAAPQVKTSSAPEAKIPAVLPSGAMPQTSLPQIKVAPAASMPGPKTAAEVNSDLNRIPSSAKAEIETCLSKTLGADFLAKVKAGKDFSLTGEQSDKSQACFFSAMESFIGNLQHPGQSSTTPGSSKLGP